MSALAIALDLGGTQARGALVDAQGSVLRRAHTQTAAASGPEAIVAQLQALVESVARDTAPERIRGVGVCSPGPLDTVSGTALGVPTIAGFADLPLRRMLEDRFHLPVQLENDGIAAALGEWRFGAGRGYDNVLYVTVSTGIGAGVITDGRVLRGRRGLAGHAGHMTIVRDGELCSCGNRGCWEAYGSGPAFARRARRRAAVGRGSALNAQADALQAADIFAAAAAGDALACDLVADEADILGVGLASLLHLFSPDVVVIGGGMSAAFAALEPGIRARLDAAAMRAFRDIDVVPAALGDNSGLIGAAALVLGLERP